MLIQCTAYIYRKEFSDIIVLIYMHIAYHFFTFFSFTLHLWHGNPYIAARLDEFGRISNQLKLAAIAPDTQT